MKQIDFIFACLCAVVDHRRHHCVQRNLFVNYTTGQVVCDLLASQFSSWSDPVSYYM